MNCRSVSCCVERPGRSCEEITLLGKIRVRGADDRTYRVQRRLWRAGLGPDSVDGVRVPEPLGVVPELDMWLQRKVPGQVATRLLLDPGGARLAIRIAEAIHGLHRTRIPVRRHHTMADELDTLRDRLRRVATSRPRWRGLTMVQSFF